MHPALRRLLLLPLLLAAPASALLNPNSAKCPAYIDTVVPAGQDGRYGRREPGDPFLASMHAVHKTLSDCATIRSLKLRVTGLGCSEWPDRWNFPFDFPSGSAYPSKLEALDLEGYAFDEKPWEEARAFPWPAPSGLERYLDWVGSGRAWKWLRWLPLSNETKALTNLDLWVRAMDFSTIKNLTLRPHGRGVDGVERMVPHLKSLEALTVYGAWAKDFIRALPGDSLRHLSWIASGQTGASAEPVLRHHATSLESIEWREPETGFRRRRVLTAAQIAALGDAAPNLKSVTLDVNQDGGWPWANLEALATKFPKVENATLFLEMAGECRLQLEQAMEGVYGPYERVRMEETACEGGREFADPPLDIRRAGKVFDFLREKNAGELRKVVFYAGDWERPWDGPLADEAWIEGKNSWVVCEVVDDAGYVGAVDEVASNGTGRVHVCRNARRRRFRWVSGEKPPARWEEDDDFEPGEDMERRARNMEL